MHIISEHPQIMIPTVVPTHSGSQEQTGQAGDPGFLHELAIAVSAEIDSLQSISKLPVAMNPFVQRLVKRTLDVVMSVIGLVLLSPVFLVVAFWIKRDSAGPVFYSQERVGKDHVTFRMIKFRTMVVDAEKNTGPVWAREGDPRITRVGRFLRHSKLDELPQLINVLRGDMSLVGPRPERPAFVLLFTRTIPGYRLRHQIRPGITGLAQLENGYDKDARDVIRKLQYDTEYIYEGNILTDLILIFRTLGRAVKGLKTVD